MVEYEPIIGMEVHVELQTESKMFCGCRVEFGGEPNTRCCPVCLGMPGSLPVVNRRAIELMAKTALALNCSITPQCIFHRKNYYYPDLPKNYQISQHDGPLGYNGYVEIFAEGRTKKIAVGRVHMEEDTGKLLHDEGNSSRVDYNRGGVPLMEIVTLNPPPEGLDQIQSPEDAREYLRRLRQILLYLGVSDVKMEEGSMRCEPNVSIRPRGRAEFGVKTEIKNLNSFRAVYMGVEYEIKRQEQVLREGGTVAQETRRWDDARGKTAPMRIKEFEQGYGYFPDPDLVPISLSQEWIDTQKQDIPELPAEKINRFMTDYGISRADAEALTDTRELADFYDSAARSSKDPRAVANWVTGELLRLVNATGTPVRDTSLTPESVCRLLKLVDEDTINRSTAKEVFEEMFRTGANPEDIVRERGLQQVTDTSELEAAVDSVIAANPSEVERFKSGETKLMGWFVGQVMRGTGGKANPAAVNKLLKEKLDN